MTTGCRETNLLRWIWCSIPQINLCCNPFLSESFKLTYGTMVRTLLRLNTMAIHVEMCACCWPRDRVHRPHSWLVTWIVINYNTRPHGLAYVPTTVSPAIIKRSTLNGNICHMRRWCAHIIISIASETLQFQLQVNEFLSARDKHLPWWFIRL